MPTMPVTPMEPERAIRHMTAHLEAVRSMRIVIAQIGALFPEIDDYAPADFKRAEQEHQELMRHLHFVLNHLEWLAIEVSHLNFSGAGNKER